MSSATDRYANEVLTDTCTISRAAASYLADGDQRVGDYETVASGVACAAEAMSIGNDMIAAGPEPVTRRRLFLAAGADIEHMDRVTLSDSTEWTVEMPPETHRLRDEAHHVEAVLREVSTE